MVAGRYVIHITERPIHAAFNQTEEGRMRRNHLIAFKNPAWSGLTCYWKDYIPARPSPQYLGLIALDPLFTRL
jgi:hypothetical protein